MISKHFQPFNPEGQTAEAEPAPYVATLSQPSSSQPPSSQPTEQPYTSIKHWAEEDRPREKLMAKGVEALTNAELLAILIGGGTTKKSAVELMQEVLHHGGDTLRGLNHMTLQDLLRFNGIGEAKALTIIAAAEIGKRRMMEDSQDIEQIRTSADVLHFMKPFIQDLTFEKSWVLLLNNNSRLIHVANLSSGGLTETAVDVRMMLKEALLHNATCFILIHNHPSGNLRPSRADDELTQKAKKAGQAVNIRMIDHVIVSEEGYYSYAECGRL